MNRPFYAWSLASVSLRPRMIVSIQRTDTLSIADGGDGPPPDEVEAQPPDLFLAGMLAARAWGSRRGRIFIGFHGRVGGPAIA